MWIVYRPGHRCSFYKKFKTSWSRHIGHVVCVWWGTFPVPVSPPSPIKFLYPYKTAWLSVLVSSVQKPTVLCVTVVSCCTLGQTVHNTWLKTQSLKLFGAPELRQSQSRPAIFLTELVEEQKDARFWSLMELPVPSYKISKCVTQRLFTQDRKKRKACRGELWEKKKGRWMKVHQNKPQRSKTLNLKRWDLSLLSLTVGGESGMKRWTSMPPAELHSSCLFYIMKQQLDIF